jgi:outer membrane protein
MTVVIKRLAAQEGYDLVVDRAMVAFVRTDLDLTDRAIQSYNAGGAAAGGGAAPEKK